MKVKFQVDQLKQIFEYLDRGNKGYLSYGDFCELAEEKRRHLDPIDDSHIEKDPQKKLIKDNW